MKITNDEHGQFILIAALMISILIVSVSAIMYGTVTYFRHERWEEYLSLIDTLKIGSRRVVEISIANYTLSMDDNVLNDNLNQWRINVTRAYSGFGIVLSPGLADGLYQVYGLNINYSQGLSSHWYDNVSYSAANVTFDLNITSIGLHGYRSMTSVFLKMNITDALYYLDNKEVGVRLIIQRENLLPIINLQVANFVEFQVDGVDKNFTFSRYYDSQTLNAFVYELAYSSSTKPSIPITIVISVIDSRGIKVTGNATLTVP